MLHQSYRVSILTDFYPSKEEALAWKEGTANCHSPGDRRSIWRSQSASGRESPVETIPSYKRLVFSIRISQSDYFRIVDHPRIRLVRRWVNRSMAYKHALLFG
jgi:hypothetical protein